MLELSAAQGGYCGGKGGSMHIADFSVGMLGANGVVARRHPDRGRRGAGPQDAEVRRDRGLHVRRRRDQPRSVPRRAQLGGAVQAAGAVRVRGQRRRGVHARRQRHGRAGRDRPRQGARRRGDHRRRQQRDGGGRCGAGRGRGGAARRGAASVACAHLSHHRPHLDRCRRLAARGRGRRKRARAIRSRGSARCWRSAAFRPTELGKIIDEAKAEMAAARSEANAAAWPEPHVAYEDVQDTGAVAWSK